MPMEKSKSFNNEINDILDSFMESHGGNTNEINISEDIVNLPKGWSSDCDGYLSKYSLDKVLRNTQNLCNSLVDKLSEDLFTITNKKYNIDYLKSSFRYFNNILCFKHNGESYSTAELFELIETFYSIYKTVVSTFAKTLKNEKINIDVEKLLIEPFRYLDEICNENYKVQLPLLNYQLVSDEDSNDYTEIYLSVIAKKPFGIDFSDMVFVKKSDESYLLRAGNGAVANCSSVYWNFYICIGLCKDSNIALLKRIFSEYRMCIYQNIDDEYIAYDKICLRLNGQYYKITSNGISTLGKQYTKLINSFDLTDIYGLMHEHVRYNYDGKEEYDKLNILLPLVLKCAYCIITFVVDEVKVELRKLTDEKFDMSYFIEASNSLLKIANYDSLNASLNNNKMELLEYLYNIYIKYNKEVDNLFSLLKQNDINVNTDLKYVLAHSLECLEFLL